MSSRLLFVGPSLAHETALALDPGLRCLPPAQHGDLLDAVREFAPAAIGLVDGYFRQHPSVWHKEILWAIAQGVRVYGAASMGALRAAELHDFGMVGVGEVFTAFRAGALPPFEGLDADDAVAVAHGPADSGYVTVSDALVDIEASLREARRRGLVDRDVATRLLEAARALPFEQRSLSRLLRNARTGGGSVEDSHGAALERLVATLPQWRVSVKRRDAEALVRAMRDATDPDDASPVPPARFELTGLFDAALEASRERVLRTAGRRALDETRSSGVGPPPPRTRRRREAALLAWLDRHDVSPDRASRRRSADRLRRRHALHDREALSAWLDAEGLSAGDYDRLVTLHARLRDIEGDADDGDIARIMADLDRLEHLLPPDTD